MDVILNVTKWSEESLPLPSPLQEIEGRDPSAESTLVRAEFILQRAESTLVRAQGDNSVAELS